MKIILTLLLSGLSLISYSQYSHSFYSNSTQGLPRHAIVASSPIGEIFASVKESGTNQLHITTAELADDGETYDYFESDINITGDNFALSGYGINGDELILCILSEVSGSHVQLHYMRFNRSTNSIVQTTTLTNLLRTGYVRSRQSGNELITYATNSSDELVRISTTSNDVAVSVTELIDPAVSQSGSLTSPQKKSELYIDNSGVEYIAKQNNLYKRDLNGNVAALTLTDWLPVQGYSLTMNNQDQLIVISGYKYNRIDINTFSIIDSGDITGMETGMYNYLEAVWDNGLIIYSLRSPDQFARRTMVDANMVVSDGINLKYNIRPYDIVYSNGSHFMVGNKGEPVNNLWSVAVIKSDGNNVPEPFLEYNTDFEYFNLVASTGHLNTSFFRRAEGNAGLLIRHNGVEKSMIYAASNSLLGKDQNDSVRGLMNYYSGADLLPGPYTSSGQDAYTSYDKHNRAFYVTREMIDFHRQYATHPWYEAPFGIKYWPGNGDASLGQAQYIAPYYDENGNGSYDPYAGDYPLIYGDRCYLNVYHLKDSSAVFGVSDVNVECLQYIYMFDCDTSEALKNTIFMNQRFILRNGELSDAYISSYIDADVGFYADDYIGTNVGLGMTYAYNGDLYDESNGGMTGFHDTLPAVGVLQLRGAPLPADGLDNQPGVGPNQSVNGVGFGDGVPDNEYYTLVSSIYHAGTSNPVTLNDYYNTFRGYYADGTSQQVNGVDIRHSYFGNSDPAFYTSDGVDHGNDHFEFGPVVNNPTGDRRIYGSTGPVQLDANSATGNTIMISNAYICAIDTVNVPYSDISGPLDLLFSYGQSIKSMYAQGDAGCDNSFDFYISPLAVGLEEVELSVSLYPNPVRDALYIEWKDADQFMVNITDLNGKLIETSAGTKQCVISTQNWTVGMYIVMIHSGNQIIRKKVVKY